jgi:hypothetical protein
MLSGSFWVKRLISGQLSIPGSGRCLATLFFEELLPSRPLRSRSTAFLGELSVLGDP